METETKETLRCALCGREGSQGFKVYEPQPVTVAGVTFETDRLVECVGRTACQRRTWRSMSPEARAFYCGSG